MMEEHATHHTAVISPLRELVLLRVKTKELFQVLNDEFAVCVKRMLILTGVKCSMISQDPFA